MRQYEIEVARLLLLSPEPKPVALLRPPIDEWHLRNVLVVFEVEQRRKRPATVVVYLTVKAASDHDLLLIPVLGHLRERDAAVVVVA
jgi:hypothetical protein